MAATVRLTTANIYTMKPKRMKSLYANDAITLCRIPPFCVCILSEEIISECKISYHVNVLHYYHLIRRTVTFKKLQNMENIALGFYKPWNRMLDAFIALKQDRDEKWKSPHFYGQLSTTPGVYYTILKRSTENEKWEFSKFGIFAFLHAI